MSKTTQRGQHANTCIKNVSFGPQTRSLMESNVPADHLIRTITEMKEVRRNDEDEIVNREKM